MKRAFKMDIAGYKFLVVNQERFNPINFGIDYHNIDNVGYDGFACFHYDGTSNKWCWSFYNDNGKVDCSKVVRSIKTDSGGHAGAAGMKLTNDEQFDFISEKI